MGSKSTRISIYLSIYLWGKKSYGKTKEKKINKIKISVHKNGTSQTKEYPMMSLFGYPISRI